MKNGDILLQSHYYFDLLGLKYLETSACQIDISATVPPGMFKNLFEPLHKKFVAGLIYVMRITERINVG